jgi:hypothetical protein
VILRPRQGPRQSDSENQQVLRDVDPIDKRERRRLHDENRQFRQRNAEEKDVGEPSPHEASLLPTPVSWTYQDRSAAGAGLLSSTAQNSPPAHRHLKIAARYLGETAETKSDYTLSKVLFQP